ncbi:MAG: enoyl-CoA hydratase/isomerase family protein [Candidatus Hodarchaeales archaeon]|jgi:enoyl-CoA hydratase
MTDEKNATSPFLFTQKDAVTIISINKPPMNPMSLELFDELEVLVPKLSTDQSVRAIVITAEGEDNFSVGMDLKQVAGVGKGMINILDQRLRVLRAIENIRKPVVATLFGYCLGGGLELPLSCHFRLAAEKGAKIGLPELDLGTVPAWGGSARLTRCVGRMHALDMILRAKMISGPEAYRIGLVNEVIANAELKEHAFELARELSEMPAIAVSEMLRCIVEYGDQPLQEGLYQERQAVLRTMGTKDNQEGMMAFLQKRKPKFNKG